DNASTDDSVRVVQELAARVPVRLITNSENRGFAAAVNPGTGAAPGGVGVILNPDDISGPGAGAGLLSFTGQPGAAAVGGGVAVAGGGALVEEDGEAARGFAFRRLPTLGALAYEALLINQLWPGNPVNRRYRCLDADYSRSQEVEQPAGACLAVTRAAWESVG